MDKLEELEAKIKGLCEPYVGDPCEMWGEGSNKKVSPLSVKENLLMSINLLSVISDLEEVIPAMPPADAPCHAGVASQNECRHCSRVSKAQQAIVVLRGML